MVKNSDDPTSGLDSSSSQLLLRALRRETLEGVNVSMVVHQPSYSLFQMFDNLILLAKGGLTVYHGSVRKVEEYFPGLGINVPERVSPQDYFIDVLEGIVKPSTSSGVNFEELPVRWMLHKGYPVGGPSVLTQHYEKKVQDLEQEKRTLQENYLQKLNFLEAQGNIFQYGSISLITEPCKLAHIATTKVAKDAGVILSYDPNLRLPLWPSVECAREGILSIWDTTDNIKLPT